MFFHRDVDDNGRSGPAFRFDFTQHMDPPTAAANQPVIQGTPSGGASNVIQQQPSQAVQQQMPPPPPPPPQPQSQIGGPTGPYQSWADFFQGKQTPTRTSATAGSTAPSAAIGGAGGSATLGGTASSSSLGATASIVMPARFLSQSTRYLLL